MPPAPGGIRRYIRDVRRAAARRPHLGREGESFFQTRGMPEPATPVKSREILERLQSLSASYGTAMVIEGSTVSVLIAK